MRAPAWCRARAATLALLCAALSVSCAALVSFDDYSPHASLGPSLDGGSPPTRGVRGTVSGLDGGTVSISLVRDLGIPLGQVAFADGPFAFPAQAGGLVDGSQFSLRVPFQPIGRGCSIEPSFGTIAGADVTGVAVTCTPQGPELAALTIRLCLDQGVDGGPCTVGTAELMPAFAPETRAYTIRSADNCGHLHVCLSVFATARYPDSTVSVRGGPLLPGKKRDLDLRRFVVAERSFTVDVTAPDGATRAQYVVAVDAVAALP